MQEKLCHCICLLCKSEVCLITWIWHTVLGGFTLDRGLQIDDLFLSCDFFGVKDSVISAISFRLSTISSTSSLKSANCTHTQQRTRGKTKSLHPLAKVPNIVSYVHFIKLLELRISTLYTRLYHVELEIQHFRAENC